MCQVMSTYPIAAELSLSRADCPSGPGFNGAQMRYARVKSARLPEISQ